jgi:hypothetical protein
MMTPGVNYITDFYKCKFLLSIGRELVMFLPHRIQGQVRQHSMHSSQAYHALFKVTHAKFFIGMAPDWKGLFNVLVNLT